MAKEKNKFHQLSWQPPAGIGIQQTRTGTLLFTYPTESVEQLRSALLVLHMALLDTAIETAREKRDREAARQQIPQTKLAALDDELHALEAKKSAVTNG